MAETLKSNPYVYANNSPSNFVDPSGKDPDFITKAIICGLSIAVALTVLIAGIAGIIVAVLTPGLNGILAALAVGIAGTGVIGGIAGLALIYFQKLCDFSS